MAYGRVQGNIDFVSPLRMVEEKCMIGKIRKLLGANMDIDFSYENFGSTVCPWNVDEKTDFHRYAVKNTTSGILPK